LKLSFWLTVCPFMQWNELTNVSEILWIYYLDNLLDLVWTESMFSFQCIQLYARIKFTATAKKLLQWVSWNGLSFLELILIAYCASALLVSIVWSFFIQFHLIVKLSTQKLKVESLEKRREGRIFLKSFDVAKNTLCLRSTANKLCVYII